MASSNLGCELSLLKFVIKLEGVQAIMGKACSHTHMLWHMPAAFEVCKILHALIALIQRVVVYSFVCLFNEYFANAPFKILFAFVITYLVHR